MMCPRCGAKCYKDYEGDLVCPNCGTINRRVW
jgi:uncharacterized Zn finger protein (UPF0148 family)